MQANSANFKCEGHAAAQGVLMQNGRNRRISLCRSYRAGLPALLLYVQSYKPGTL